MTKEKSSQITQAKYETKTYRITKEAVSALEEITERLSTEARFRISMGKVIELAIFNAQTKSLEELLKLDS